MSHSVVLQSICVLWCKVQTFILLQDEDNVLMLQIVNLWLDISGTLMPPCTDAK